MNDKEQLNNIARESGVGIYIVQRMYEIVGIDKLLDTIEDYIWELHSLDIINDYEFSNPYHRIKTSIWERV